MVEKPDSVSTWPILTTYTGESLREVAFPVGGIGTGTVALGGRANLQDFEVCNRPDKGFTPPWSFFALRVQPEGCEPVTRVLEGVFSPPFTGSHGVMPAAVGTPRSPMLRASGAGLPRMRYVRLDAAYPLAHYTLSDPEVPAVVHLEAFNPMIPLDVSRSSLPLAVLRYTVVNPLDRPLSATIAGSLYNFIGRTLADDGEVRFLGGNINSEREARVGAGLALRGLLMSSSRVPRETPEDGTLALVVLSEEATVRCTWGDQRWNRHLASFWRDLSEDGRLDDPGEAQPSSEGWGMNGSVAAPLVIGPHGQAAVTFLLCWHFPHRTAAGCGWTTVDEDGGYVGNYYTQSHTDAWDVAAQVAPQLPTLEEETVAFVRTFVASDLPQAVKEAALNNASTLRTQTCFRTADGNFFGFEGAWDQAGCCSGSCTHVWNYEQTTPFLYPELARTMRALELDHGTLESGLNCFRLLLPLGQANWEHAAADGQMGVVMKCYREWQLSGDIAFLAQRWATIKSLLEFCWLPGGWDADQDGVMEGVQHNTSDIEFFGPNPLSGILYLGALRAGQEMARALGDESFAATCGDLFARGSAWIDEHLFNGEYYVQRIEPPDSLDDVLPELALGLGGMDVTQPIFQLGNGCLTDQLMGQYMAHVIGLGYLLNAENVASAVQAVFRHNFRANLYDTWNNLRAFALADESALLVCSWPDGDPPPEAYFRFCEVWTGVEYQAAALLFYEGYIEEGLAVVEAVRRRFDGVRRNPWNEPECGHHYARAMAAWSLMLALSGFHYSAVTETLSLAPRWRPEAFHSFWVAGSAWGSVEQRLEDDCLQLRWSVGRGALGARTLRCRVPAPSSGQVSGASLTLDAAARPVTLEQEGSDIYVHLSVPVTLDAGQELLLRLTIDR